MSSPEFASEMVTISIAQLMNMIGNTILTKGIDRIHYSGMQTIVEIVEQLLILLAKKTMKQAELSSRTMPCVLDTINMLESLDMTYEDLVVYIEAITAKKDRSKAPFTFPRPEPAPFPASKPLIQEPTPPPPDKEEIEANAIQTGVFLDKEKPETSQDMDIDDQEHTCPPFPEFPTKKDQDFLDEILQQVQVPLMEVEEEQVIPQTEVSDLKSSESLYYKAIPFEEAKTTFLKDYIEVGVPAPKVTKKTVNMEECLLETFSNTAMDPKIRAPMSQEDILKLFSFRTGYGVAIPDNTTSGYESKSMVNDLLILRLPACHTLFGGERILDHEIRVQEELASLQKGRKREKERDSGQGKAPVKMSAAKLAKKRAADIAAGRIPAKPIKEEEEGKEEEDEEEEDEEEDEKSETNIAPLKISVPTPAATISSRPSSAKSQTELIACICANSNIDYGLFMISCDVCQAWFHGSCVQVYESLQTWTCPKCK